VCKKHSSVSMHINTPKVKEKKPRNMAQNYINIRLNLIYHDRSNSNAFRFESHDQDVFQKDGSQLGMCQRKRPKTKVGSGVRNCSKHEFDGFNQLMNEHL